MSLPAFSPFCLAATLAVGLQAYVSPAEAAGLPATVHNASQARWVLEALPQGDFAVAAVGHFVVEPGATFTLPQASGNQATRLFRLVDRRGRTDGRVALTRGAAAASSLTLMPDFGEEENLRRVIEQASEGSMTITGDEFASDDHHRQGGQTRTRREPSSGNMRPRNLF